MFEERVAIVAATRTTIGRSGGALREVGALDLATTVSREAIARAGLPSAEVQRLVAGENMQVIRGGNPARHMLLRAGIPQQADDYSINMNCSSGLRTMTCLAQDILLGDVTGRRRGRHGKHERRVLPARRRALRLPAGERDADRLPGRLHPRRRWPTAENVAEAYGIGRRRQDEFAADSQQRASAAIDGGLFKEQITPAECPAKGGPVMFDAEEHPRPGVTADTLARLRPAFAAAGTVTAGNSAGINDGAAAVLLTSEAFTGEAGLTAASYLRGWAAAGVDPRMFGIGPVPAVRKLLDRVGLKLSDIDLIELNEAFASSTLAVIGELGLDPEVVNVNGGAIALGHPVGATGLVLVTKLVQEMRRRGVDRGVVTTCVGSGQRMAALVELNWAGRRPEGYG